MTTSRKAITENSGAAVAASCRRAFAEPERALRRRLTAVSPKAEDARELEDPFMRGFQFLVGSLAIFDSPVWECQTARHLQSVYSYSAFRGLLKDPDSNVRMFALEAIGRYGHLLSRNEQAQMRQATQGLLHDHSPSNYMYGGSQSDEDDLHTVAKMAQRALRCLEHRMNPESTSWMSFGICLPVRQPW